MDIRGRSKTLRVNYRTSHQIRTQADRLLGPVVTDVDGNSDRRDDTVSVLNGPPPIIQTFATEEQEIQAVSDWLAARARDGLPPQEMAVIVRSEAEFPRALDAVKASNLTPRKLDFRVETATGQVSVCTMHLAKGLEFRAVAVMACDDEVIPSQERISTAGETTDLKDIYETERQLLYVACTRARDHLLVTALKPGSEFLGDMGNV